MRVRLSGHDQELAESIPVRQFWRLRKKCPSVQNFSGTEKSLNEESPRLARGALNAQQSVRMMSNQDQQNPALAEKLQDARCQTQRNKLHIKQELAKMVACPNASNPMPTSRISDTLKNARTVTSLVLQSQALEDSVQCVKAQMMQNKAPSVQNSLTKAGHQDVGDQG